MDKIELINQVSEAEQFIWENIKDPELRFEWDDYADGVLDDNRTNYWDEVDEADLQNALEIGNAIIERAGLTMTES